MLLLVSGSSAHFHSWGAGSGHTGVWRYVFGIGWQWLVVAFLWWGVRKRGGRLVELVGGGWPTVAAVVRDFGIAIGFLIVSYVILGWLAHVLRPARNQPIAGLLPHGRTEIFVYLAMAVSAGVTEENIFRGYLQRQLSAISNNAIVGLVVQGIVFGASHGYQGGKRMLIIGVFGCLFGALADWRRSLKPGMIAHALHDGVIGVMWSLIKH